MSTASVSALRSRWLMLPALVAAFAAWNVLPASAQQISTEVKGKVIGVDGKPLQNAEMVFTRTDISGTFSEKTNKNGEFDYHTLPMGTYDISVKTPDGKTYPMNKGVRTQPGAAVIINPNIAVLSGADNADGSAPPPGMTPEQAAEYQKKVKEQQAASQKVGQLNVLLKQNSDFVEAKQYDKAIAVMTQAVALDQTHDVLYANLGKDYDDAKQYQQAADAYSKAVALKPRSANYLINEGTDLLQVGKLDDANAAFAKANEIDPSQTKMAMYNTGVILLNQGKMDSAASAFDKLLAIDPSNANAWYYKGICLISTAQTDPKTNKMIAPPGAADAFKKAIQLDPNGPNAANAKAALQSLGGI